MHEVMSSAKQLQVLIEKTDNASRRFLDNPHSRELLAEYSVVKKELRDSVVTVRKALEAIHGYPKSQ